MRPTGQLHLGHYHGVLKNWVQLQSQYPCFFFVADWHALTTHYESPEVIEASVWEMVIDWLAAGVDPNKATLFIQSRVPEHAELFLLLSMGTPLGWLERVPTYKDQIEKLKEKDLQTYGFLGYPLLQSADILIYRAQHVPVGEDQVPHVEMTREVARRFNNLYGSEPGFEAKALESVKKLGSKAAKLYTECRIAYQERGEVDALERAPTDGFANDSTVTVAIGETWVVRIDPQLCSFGDAFFAKLVVDDVNALTRRMAVRVLINRNCGYRDLTVGLPRN
jgi:tryptophanyl-tRNA synthetase